MILFVGNFCFDFAMSQFFFEISLVQCVEFEYAVDWLCGHCFEDAQGTACPNFGSGLLRKVIDVFYRCPFWEQFEWMVSPKSCGGLARYIQRHPAQVLSHVVRRTVNDLWGMTYVDRSKFRGDRDRRWACSWPWSIKPRGRFQQAKGVKQISRLFRKLFKCS